MILNISTNTPEAPLLEPTDANLALAKEFLLECWRKRAVRRKRERPDTLENACKFATLYAIKLFGGDVRGNWYHIYAVCGIPARIVDLTDAAGVGPEQCPPELKGQVPEFNGPYEHDAALWTEPDAVSSVLSCASTAWRWADQFRRAHPELYPTKR